MNPKYERNLQLDAKLVAAAFRGQHVFFRVAAGMKLWSSPNEAALYARQIKLQDPEYCKRVGQLASRLLALAE